MKNYYQQVTEYELAKVRLETLKEKHQVIFNQVTNCTSSLKEDVVSSTPRNDKMLNYTIECEELNESIQMQEEIIKIYEDGLKKMEELWKKLKGKKERIFKLYFVDNKSITHISMVIPCSEKTVYNYIKQIKEELQ